MEFEKGDFVVYTPNIPNLPDARFRKEHWGFIRDMDERYIEFDLYNKYDYDDPPHHILRYAITHNPYSKKYIRNLFVTHCLPAIIQAVEAREARRILLTRTPFSSQTGPVIQIIERFITNHVRTKYNARNI